MPSDEGIQTPLPPNVLARLATAARYAISGVAPTTWFGPQQPLAPMAPPEVKGRQFDYPFGVNINYTLRSTRATSASSNGSSPTRCHPDCARLSRPCKDQIAATAFSVRPRDPTQKSADAAARIKSAQTFLSFPDRRHSFCARLRMLPRTCW